MACINMFNPDHQHQLVPMSPRISFSNDFVVQPPPVACNPSPPADPNFEFSSVGSRPMIAADQLFFKGKLLPLKENNCYGSNKATTTLRDELLASDNEVERPMKGNSMKWKEFLGLKKNHCSTTKKNICDHKNDQVVLDVEDHNIKSMQEM